MSRTVLLLFFTSGGILCQTWEPLRSVTQVGRAVINLDEPAHPWRYLLVKWASPCAGPRSLTINGSADHDANLLSRDFSSIAATGKLATFIPTELSHLTVTIDPGGCDGATQIDILTTTDSVDQVLCADPVPELAPSEATSLGSQEVATTVPNTTGKKPKPPKAVKGRKAPTQADIARGCILIYDIYSHALGILSGILAPEPGVEAKIKNNCGAPAQVFLRIGYFDSRGMQFGGGILSATVAAGAVYPVYHEARVYGLDRGSLKLAKIIAVNAYPQ